MKIFGFLLFAFTVINVTSGQSVGAFQTLHGQVKDLRSGEPVPYANVLISNEDYSKGAVTDLDGKFQIEGLALGRYDLTVSFVGYKDFYRPDMVLASHQLPELSIALEESSFDLDEVVVKPLVDKSQAQNQMAAVSARLLSVEEANRYAGGFDDPARLASAFAGVASKVGTNGIVVRGNAPKYLQWRMEGIEIPNPNHFANLAEFGGGGLTALSSLVMDNADFLTGAMPATYQNALSGVFDLSMRRGSSSEHRHKVQIGLIGLDFASEGPLSRSQKSSYLINYRYSTLSLLSSFLPPEAMGTKYQDLSFKLTFPNLDRGVIEWWGLGLIDNSGTNAISVEETAVYSQDLLAQEARQDMGATGLKYTKYLQNNWKQIWKSQVALTTSRTDVETQKRAGDGILYDENRIFNGQSELVLSSNISSKFGLKHLNVTGFDVRVLDYDLGLSEARQQGLAPIVDDQGASVLSAFHSSSSVALTPQTSLVGGFSTQYFALNREFLVEPRLSLSHLIKEGLKLSVAYGKHSRLEPLHYYFIQDDRGASVNQDLELSKAHHYVLSLQWNPSKAYMVKIEPYYQRLYDIPFDDRTGRSFLNLQNDWFLDNPLMNKGRGKNLGIDLTVEKYINNGLYGLFTASIFDSRYLLDGTWFNTRYNSRYLANFLVGKEFQVGQKGNKILSINSRASYQGGQPYTPVDLKQSLAAGEIILEDSRPFTERFDPSLILHFTINYVVSRPSASHAFSLKVLNAGGYKEFVDFRINHSTQRVDTYREALVIPNLSYRISF